jgi:hypothetical protein
MPNRNVTGLALAATYLLGLFLMIYGPTVGQGFVADDFGWLSATRPSIGHAAGAAFDHAYGFYPSPTLRCWLCAPFSWHGWADCPA